MRFTDLQLIEPLLRAVAEEGYTDPTPIQAQAIPHVLAGKDLLGLAQTGTGKTAAFALPILQRLSLAHGKQTGHRPIRVLVVTPTRELASQIGESFATYGRHLGFRHSVVFGGVGQRPQEDALRRGIDVLIATPGRFLDLHGQGFIKLDRLEVFVLDEADRMLDMGFLPDVRRVIATLPKVRQTLFFSATMPPEARALADALLHHPAKVSVVPQATTADKIEQSLFHVEKQGKTPLLVALLKEDPAMTRVLVFTRTKHGANKVAQGLERAGIGADAIHGNKSQTARERALADFKAGRVRVLVATDIAARGIDVEQISHVVNYDLPNVPESYVHRIGRTARAGASGIAIAFCSGEERTLLADIQKLIRQQVPVRPTPPLPQGAGRAPEHARGPRSAPSHGHSRPSHGSRPSHERKPSTPHAPRERFAPPPPATGGGEEPAWMRYSYRSSSAPTAPRKPSGGGGRGRRRRGR
jgi:ATP-dependent RNA helicase RhlE